MTKKLGDAVFFPPLLTTKFSLEVRVARQLSHDFLKKHKHPRVKVRKVEDGEIMVQKFCECKLHVTLQGKRIFFGSKNQ